jgi:hypothetical protein
MVGFAAIGIVSGLIVSGVDTPAGDVADRKPLTVNRVADVPGAVKVNVMVFPLLVAVTIPVAPVDAVKKKSDARARVAPPSASRTVIVHVTTALAETVAPPSAPTQARVDATSGTPMTVNVKVPAVPDVNAVVGAMRPWAEKVPSCAGAVS